MLENDIYKHYYGYNDDYMYFTFRGVHSSQYNLFIISNNEQPIENTVGAQSSFSNAFLQDGTYYLGTSATQKVFKRTCATRGLTLEQYKDMMLWLRPGETGQLSFDSDPYWCWDVVVDTVGDGKWNGGKEEMIVQFDITFKTIGTYLAHNRYTTIWETIQYSIAQGDDKPTKNQIIASVASGNQYHIPAIYIDSSNDKSAKIYLQGISNIKQTFELFLDIDSSWSEPMIVDIAEKYHVHADDSSFDTTVYESAKLQTDIATDIQLLYDSQNGVLLTDNGLADKDNRCAWTKQLNGLMKLPSNAIYEIGTPIKVEYETGKNKFEVTAEQYQLLQTYAFDYVVAVNSATVGTCYGVTSYKQGQYSATNTSYIGFKFQFITEHIPQYDLLEKTDSNNETHYYLTLEGPQLSTTDTYTLVGGNSHVIQVDISGTHSKISDMTVTLKSLNNM